MSPGERRELGLRPWGTVDDSDIESGPCLWILPGEWYDELPEGYEFVSILGEVVKFEAGVSDDDIRFGLLPYGILCEPLGSVPE